MIYDLTCRPKRQIGVLLIHYYDEVRLSLHFKAKIPQNLDVDHT